jgi:L-aminopeptidase/D-esterase-like protein
MKGGLGSASLRLPGGIVVGALAAVNSLGDVVDPETGELLAGAIAEDGKTLANSSALIRSGLGFGSAGSLQNTTLVIVGANVSWTKAQATKAAQMAQDGLARAIRPVHMPFDGDTVFALGTGGVEADASKLGLLGAVAADVVSQAIVSAILHAESAEGRPSRRELLGDQA